MRGSVVGGIDVQASSVSLIGVSQVDEQLAGPDNFDDQPTDTSYLEVKSERLVPSLWFVASMAALGIVSALGWHYSGIAQWAGKPARTAQAAAAAPAAEIELARLAREVETLNSTLNEVIAVNSRLAAAVSALQLSQQEVKRRVASGQTDGWHAQIPAMKYHIVAQPKGTTGSVKARSAARAEVGSIPKPTDHAPLQLTAPRL